jgi:hypothetical protein
MHMRSLDCNLANEEYVRILKFEEGPQEVGPTLSEEPTAEDPPSDPTQEGMPQFYAHYIIPYFLATLFLGCRLYCAFT